MNENIKPINGFTRFVFYLSVFANFGRIISNIADYINPFNQIETWLFICNIISNIVIIVSFLLIVAGSDNKTRKIGVILFMSWILLYGLLGCCLGEWVYVYMAILHLVSFSLLMLLKKDGVSGWTAFFLLTNDVANDLMETIDYENITADTQEQQESIGEVLTEQIPKEVAIIEESPTEEIIEESVVEQTSQAKENVSKCHIEKVEDAQDNKPKRKKVSFKGIDKAIGTFIKRIKWILIVILVVGFLGFISWLIVDVIIPEYKEYVIDKKATAMCDSIVNVLYNGTKYERINTAKEILHKTHWGIPSEENNALQNKLRSYHSSAINAIVTNTYDSIINILHNGSESERLWLARKILYKQYDWGLIEPEKDKFNDKLKMNYTEAFDTIETHAYANNAECQHILGNYYYHSINHYHYPTTTNYDKAAYWYSEAIKNGNFDACNNLANLYFDGEGVKQNKRKAIALYKQGAEAGEPYAQYNLGGCYSTGIKIRLSDRKVRVSGDNQEKIEEKYRGHNPRYLYSEYHKSYWKPVYKYSTIYQEYRYEDELVSGWYEYFYEVTYTNYETILPQDQNKALYWWRKAAAQGHEGAKDKLEKIY